MAVMDHLGYPGLDLKDVEDLPSVVLDERFPRRCSLLCLSLRPRSLTSVLNQLIPAGESWCASKQRAKLLTKGISEGYLLFNRFQTDLDRFRSETRSDESRNTQLILAKERLVNFLKYRLYFLVFFKHAVDRRQIDYVSPATFDARAPNIVEIIGITYRCLCSLSRRPEGWNSRVCKAKTQLSGYRSLVRSHSKKRRLRLPQ